MIDDQNINHHIAAIVANWFDPSIGIRGSSGEMALINAACLLDDHLLDQLALGFPGLVAAIGVCRTWSAEALLEQAWHGEAS